MTTTSASLAERAHDGNVRDGDDPAAKPARRRFSEKYKLDILKEYEALSDPGAKVDVQLRVEDVDLVHDRAVQAGVDVIVPMEER